MRFGAMHMLAIAAASMASVVVHDPRPFIPGRRELDIVTGPRLVGIRGENAHPLDLNRLARKNARARQTKRGKRGRL